VVDVFGVAKQSGRSGSGQKGPGQVVEAADCVRGVQWEVMRRVMDKRVLESS